MASVYRKNTGIYYISVMFQNKRITRSLGTRSYKTARKVISQVEKQILSELVEGEEECTTLILPVNNSIHRVSKS